MLITVRGRVEMDPMRVPQAASMATGSDDAFEQVLQQTVAADETPVAESGPRESEPDADLDEATTATLARTEDELELPAETASNESLDDTTTMTTGGRAADVTESIRRGEPERQETAGKGTDSPRTSARTVEPLLAAVVQHNAGANNAPFVVAGSGERTGAIGGVRAGDAATRGTGGLQARTTAPLRAPAVQAPYRANEAASAELLEQARDSVFKQILMKLSDDGGEMRLRLQPPDLGELDLRLVVEGGNRLNLTIAADRQDVAGLLQRHLDELKTSLQQAGLEVTGASVQTRSEFAREQRQRDAEQHGGHAGAAPQQLTTTNDRQRGGYVTATGLDFWA